MQSLDMTQLHRDLIDLNSKIQRMVDVIEVVKDKQEEMAEIALMKAQSRRDALKKIGIG